MFQDAFCPGCCSDIIAICSHLSFMLPWFLKNYGKPQFAKTKTPTKQNSLEEWSNFICFLSTLLSWCCKCRCETPPSFNRNHHHFPLLSFPPFQYRSTQQASLIISCKNHSAIINQPPTSQVTSKSCNILKSTLRCTSQVWWNCSCNDNNFGRWKLVIEGQCRH